MNNAYNYLVAAAAYVFAYEEDEVEFPDNEAELSKRFLEFYGKEISVELSRRIIFSFGEVGLIGVVEEEYAGLIISFDQSNFDSTFGRLADAKHGKFIDVSQSAGEVYRRTINNDRFWADLETALKDGGDQQAIKLAPASDRIVTILHNSEEGKLLISSIDKIVDNLETNNEVAAQAGQDRDRLISEGKASRQIILGVEVSAKNLKNLVLSFFKEIYAKFKAKSAEWGVDKAMDLIEKIIEFIK